MSHRILHVVPTYLPATRYGGPIYSVHGLCRALAARGHDVHVFTTDVDGPGRSAVPLATPVMRDGVNVWYFPTAFGRRLYRSPVMAQHLSATIGSFDIAHLHSVFLWPTTAAARAARSKSVPYVLAPRGMLVADLIRRKSRLLKTAWIALFERANIAGAASMHVTAEIEADEIKRMGLSTSRFDVVPNGIDLQSDDRCSVDDDARWPRQPGVQRVLSLGRLNWKKGLDRLIPAMRHCPDAELILAGNDEEGYRRRLEQLADGLGLSDRVHFIGPVHGPDKWRLLASADVFVMPSYSENFGIAALEAMAAGRPVIVTPEVGLAGAVAQAGAGLVVDGAPGILGAAIAGLLSDDARRAAMGAAGRHAAASTYSWDSVAHRMESVYSACIDAHRTDVTPKSRDRKQVS